MSRSTNKGNFVLDIKTVEMEIVERLEPLDPEKIILFGSYAYGTPNKDSDIDLMLIKETTDSKYEAKALMRLRDLISKYNIGFDVISASSSAVNSREDYFVKEEILNRGKVLYVKK